MESAIDLSRIKFKRLKRIKQRRIIGSISARVLAINILALAILAAGFLYLDQYQAELLNLKAEAVNREGRIIARALIGETMGLPSDADGINLPNAIATLQRLAIPTERRVRLFLNDGYLGADSYTLPGVALDTRTLPPPEEIGLLKRISFKVYDWVVSLIPPYGHESLSQAPDQPSIENFSLLKSALFGQYGNSVLSLSSGERVIFVALPLQTVRRVQGALLITAGTDDIDRSVRDVRFALVIAFLAALLITILLSLYLARTITRPVKRLAQAADAVSAGLGKKSSIPDFGNRRDEIGNLSISLTTMTDTLWSRMEAIENFVADVAHEIKNPLTSLRSAVEAMRRIKDKNKREELLDIITADVVRLDKLLSEIAEASRIDTELSRLDPKPLNISKMLETLLALHQYQLDVISPKKIKVLIDKDETYFTLAVADRMAQVFQNLIDNALSFSPPNGTVTISVARNNEWIEMCVSDNGPGVPNDSLERIFERFYTYRNKNNTFGSHSGLGLAISRQIVSRYGGSIICTNLNDDSGAIVGARLKVKLVSLIPNTKK